MDNNYKEKPMPNLENGHNYLENDTPNLNII